MQPECKRQAKSKCFQLTGIDPCEESSKNPVERKGREKNDNIGLKSILLLTNKRKEYQALTKLLYVFLTSILILS